MNTFAPRDWLSGSRWFEAPERDRRRAEEKNREAAQRWLLVLSFCCCFASLAPAKLFPSDSRRRLWLACLEAAARRRSSSAEKSALTVTAVAMARILPRHGISSTSRGESPTSQNSTAIEGLSGSDNVCELSSGGPVSLPTSRTGPTAYALIGSSMFRTV